MSRCAPKTPSISTRALLSQNYNARENSHLLRYPDTRNARDTPEPKELPSTNRWGYFRNLPHISDKRVHKPWFPTPIPSAHLFIHQGRKTPHPVAGASAPTTSSTTTPRRPSSTVPDEDPSSISSSRRFSHPVLHIQAAAPMFPSSFAPPPFPHHRLHLHHRKSIIITVSSDEAAA